jgi:hypothetical protein
VDTLTRDRTLRLAGIELRGHPHPGQHYKHGWIPIGAVGNWESLSGRARRVRESAGSLVVKSEGNGGFMGGTARETHADGTVTIHKTPRDAEGITGVHQADAEELGSLVANAVGVRAPAVYRAGPTELQMEFMDGRHIDHSSISPWVAPPEEVVNSDQGRLLGLFDLLAGNPDRHAGNFLLQDDGGIVAIDHALSFGHHASNGLGYFSDEFSNEAHNNWAEHIDISPGDLTLIRQRLESLRPEFERLHRLDWFDTMMENLAIFEPRAVGTTRRVA